MTKGEVTVRPSLMTLTIPADQNCQKNVSDIAMASDGSAFPSGEPMAKVEWTKRHQNRRRIDGLYSPEAIRALNAAAAAARRA